MEALNITEGNEQPEFLSIEERLESVFAVEDTQVVFECTLKAYPQATCTWYREGTMLQINQRNYITSYKKHSNLEVHRLEIRNITAADKGIYSVICRNNSNQASSHASLLVANKDETDGIIYYPVIDACQKITHNQVTLKSRNIQVQQGESIELEATFKNAVDQIIWYKNNEQITENLKTMILASNRISVLTIMKSTFDDTGTYYVIGKSHENPVVSSLSYVYVVPVLPGLIANEICSNLTSEKKETEENTPKPERVENNFTLVQRPLTSVVASLGCNVLFDCSFVLYDDTFHYVIWYVGQYRIERTNSQFSVLNKGGDFLLYIRNLEPEMAGEVVCELRRALPTAPSQSTHVMSTTGTLAIAPRCVVEQEKEANPSLKTGRLFQVQPGDTMFNTERGYDSKEMVEIIGKCFRKDKMEVKITYCRLNEMGLFYFFASICDIEVNTTIQIKDGDPRIIHITVDKSVLPPETWYAIDVAQSDGIYVEVGVSSEPNFAMKDTPVMNVVKIRMRPVTPLERSAESSIYMCIAPQEEEDRTPLKSADLRNMEEFTSDYTTTGDKLGLGSFGSVVLVQDARGKYFAAKKMRTPCKGSRGKALAEYEIMKRLQHPKVIHLVEGFRDIYSFIIVMEYLWGGELFDRVVQEEHIQEEDVVSYVRQICEALVYIHKQHIVHLDIKPENIVCRSPNSCRIKIIDFGIAIVLEGGHATRSLQGTKDYIPPEILNYEEVTTACDMWSLGVVTYILLSGLTPFYSESWSEMSAKIIRAEYGYEDEAFNNVSWLSRNFIDRLLLINASDRLTAEQALQHSWLKFGPPKGPSARHSMRRTRENLKTYLVAYRSKWQRARNVVIAAHRLRISGHATASRNSPSE